MALITWQQYKSMTGDNVHTQAVAESAIEAASSVLYQYIGERFTNGERTEKHYFEEPRKHLNLKAFPITGETVTVTGATPKYIDMESGILLFKVPVTGEVTVTYTGGLTEVPEAVEQACALLAMHIMSGVEQGGQEVSSEALGDYSTTYRATNGKLPDVVWMLIGKYTR